ncbi:MAG TPA: glycosyltransferase [Acidimicrobiales bacterium]|nr:glycosyltransferase [Acidimicrobiales bacterium]
MSRRTRIVQLANFYGPESGGLRTVLEELGRGYRRAGFERFSIVPGERDAETTTDAGTRITLAAPLLPGGGGYRVLSSRRRVEAVLERIDPQRLEVSDKLSLVWVGRWASARSVPCVMLSHERLDAILAARVPGWFPLARAADWWNRRLVARFDRVVCTSTFAAEEFERIGTTNLVRVPLGVDLDLFRPRQRKPSASTRLVTVGRLSKEKRPDLAIETLRALRRRGIDAHLTLVGAGPLRSRLAAAAEDLPVRFTGHLDDRTVVAEVLAEADAVLAPCPVESFGLSVLEALAAGTPVVVADGGASVELIDRGSGRTAAPEPAAMADAVAEVLALPDRRASARARAERYPWSRTVDGMLAAHCLTARPLEVTA